MTATERHQKYAQTEHGRAVITAYLNRPEVKMRKAARRREARATPEGRARRKAENDARKASWYDEHDAYKLAAQCGDCDGAFDDPKALHCHHVDPSTKVFELADGWSYGQLRREAELAKCVVLCQPCHTERHRVRDVTNRGIDANRSD